MPTDSSTWLLILFSFAVTFIAARVLGTRWRARRKERAEQAAQAHARANESRQARRARERKQKGS